MIRLLISATVPPRRCGVPPIAVCPPPPGPAYTMPNLFRKSELLCPPCDSATALPTSILAARRPFHYSFSFIPLFELFSTMKPGLEPPPFTHVVGGGGGVLRGACPTNCVELLFWLHVLTLLPFPRILFHFHTASATQKRALGTKLTIPSTAPPK